MAAIDFPSGPTNGQLYTNPATGLVYVYNSTYSAWQASANSTVGYTGSVGFTGSIGSIGFTGSVGYSGSQGNIGYTGSDGAFAAVGFTGSIGFTGSAGGGGGGGFSNGQSIEVANLVVTGYITGNSYNSAQGTTDFGMYYALPYVAF